MGQDIFLELDKINTTLLQQAEENVDVTVCSKPSLDSAVAGAGIGALTAGMLAASTIGSTDRSASLECCPYWRSYWKEVSNCN